MKPATNRVRRMMIEVVRRADLLDAALVHHHDAVGKRHGLDLVVCHVDGRRLHLLVHALDLGAHLHAQLGVEVGQRLVEQEDLGVAHDGAAHGDALTLAAGERFRPALEQFGDVENARGVLDPLLDLGLGEFAQLQAEGHVVEGRHVRIERVVLEHHGDVAVLRRQIVDHLAADADVAGGDFLQPRDHPQRRRLAAARRADQHDELVVRDVQIDRTDGFDVAVLLHDLTQRDFSHAAQPLVAPAVRPAM